MLLGSLYKNQQKSLYIVFCKSLFKYRKEIVGNQHQKSLYDKTIVNKHIEIIVQVLCGNRCISMLLESLYKKQQKSLYIVFCKSLYKYRKEIVGNRHQKSLYDKIIVNKHTEIIVQVCGNRCISMLLELLYKKQQKSLYIVFCKSLYKYRK